MEWSFRAGRPHLPGHPERAVTDFEAGQCGAKSLSLPGAPTPDGRAARPSHVDRARRGHALLVAWSLALAALLVLPSIRLWAERPLSLTEHEFDFFLGLSSRLASASAGDLVVAGRVLGALLLLAAGLVYLRLARRTETELLPAPDTRLFLYASFLSGIYAVGLPWLSPDIFYYIGLGWLEARYDLDPFLHAIANVPGYWTDEMFANVFPGFWGLPGTYGPLFQSLATGLAAASGGNVLVALLLFKLVGLASHVAASGLVLQMAPPHQRRLAFFAFACNPLILLNALTGAHNDHLMIVFLLVSFYFRRSQRPFASGVSFGCAFGVKYVPALLLPLFVVDFFLPTQPTRPGSVRRPLAFLFGFCTTVAVLALRYPNSVQSFVSAVERGSGVMRSSVFYLVAAVDSFVVPLPIPLVHKALQASFLILALTSVALLVRDRRAGRSGSLERSSIFLMVSYFLTLNTSNHEWYLTWLIGPALVGAGAAGITLALRLSALFMPLVIFTVRNPVPVSWVSNAGLYLLLLLVSMPFLLESIRRDPSAPETSPPEDGNDPVRSDDSQLPGGGAAGRIGGNTSIASSRPYPPPSAGSSAWRDRAERRPNAPPRSTCSQAVFE